MELLGICPGALERSWPMCCLIFPKHILCFSQCILSQSTKSLNQKPKILQDDAGWLILIFNFIDLDQYKLFCYLCLLQLFLPLILSSVWMLRRCWPSAKAGMVMVSGHGMENLCPLGFILKSDHSE